MITQDAGALSKALAREIFKLGDEPKRDGSFDRVQRLQFKGGTYPDAETSLGGLNEHALATYIERFLERHAPPKNTGL